MDNRKIDLASKDQRTEAPSHVARIELNDDELSKVSGGSNLYQACVTGKHITTGRITCR
jgi:bacteriocin-like protein